MTKPIGGVVLHSEPLAQLHLCVYLHAHTLYRVVGIPRSRADLEAVFTKTTVDLILCGGAFLLLRHHDRPASLEWLRRRLGRTGAKGAVCSLR